MSSKRNSTDTLVICYGRTSSENQRDNHSLGQQREAILAFVSQDGHDPDKIIWVEDESRSGRGLDRKGYQFIMDIVGSAPKKAPKLIVCHSLSRLWRSDDSHSELKKLREKRNCNVVALSTGVDTRRPINQWHLQVGIENVVNANFSLQLSDTMRRMYPYVSEKGGRMGYCPYGWKLTPVERDDAGNPIRKAGTVRQAFPDPEEQANIRIVWELAKAGYSNRKIGTTMSMQEIKNRTGTFGWHPSKKIAPLLDYTEHDGIFFHRSIKRQTTSS